MADSSAFATVGRIVHYVSYGTPGGEFLQECRAAIVAGLPGVSTMRGHVDERQVVEPKGGTWHWPERTDG